MSSREPTHARKNDWQTLGELTVDDASQKFDGKWILMRVTQYDEYYSPAKGVVVSVNRSRNGIQPDALAAVEDAKLHGNHYYIYKGFQPIRSGAEWIEALNRVAHSTRRRGDIGQTPDNDRHS